MKAVLLAAVVFATYVGTAGASADFNVVTQQAVPIGGTTGTFTMTGDLADAGTFRFTSFLFTSGEGSPVTTEHVLETWNGAAGTLTVQKQCRSVFIGFGATDDCQAAVNGDTGAYAGLHGTGMCTGLINFITGIASQTCSFRLQG